MLLHLLIWSWTILLHLWELCYHDNNDYYSRLKQWNKNGYIFDLRYFSQHPAWIDRYMHCSCFQYAQAYHAIYGGTMEVVGFLENDIARMAHVYVVDDFGYIHDFLGRTTKSSLIRTEGMFVQDYQIKEWDSPFPSRIPGEVYVLKQCIREWIKL